MHDEELGCFPLDQLEPTQADFRGGLVYNPFGTIPPCIWYRVGVDLAEIDLGDAAYAPDLFGRTLDTSLLLGGIVIPDRS